MKDSKRGGSRPGAGRPAKGRTTECITLTLPKEIAEKLRKDAKEKNVTVSTYVIESLARFENMIDEEPKPYDVH